GFISGLFVKATGRLLSDLLHRGQWAEPVGLNCENGIKLAAKVLQSDNRRELDQLFLAKMPLEAVEKTIRDPLVCVSHPFAKLQSERFAQGEERDLTVIPESGRPLLFRCAASPST